MKIIKEDVLVLLSIGSFVLANVDQCNIGDGMATWGLGSLIDNSYTI
jgi:hypothetical protein